MSDTSLWTFIAHADLVVKSVLIILLIASVVSWTIIVQRMLMLRKTQRLIAEFEQMFWTGADLGELKRKIPNDQSALATIFHAGYLEYIKQRKQAVQSPQQIVQSVQRAMRVMQQRVMRPMITQIPILATIGSTAPFVGLFGTVWGIMSSFQSLGGVEQATIAMVAPGISEALIATAVGLFAAIPAVVAYNRFTNQLDLIAESCEMFQDELSGVLTQYANTDGEQYAQ